MTELDEIKAKYESGKLEDIRQDLERFIRAHAQGIVRFKQEQIDQGRSDVSDETAVQYYIICQRSINPEREIVEQVREIEREKWIRGVHTGCPPDPNAVAIDWAFRHSIGWRAHRVASIIYVFSREKDRYLRILREALEARCA